MIKSVTDLYLQAIEIFVIVVSPAAFSSGCPDPAFSKMGYNDFKRKSLKSCWSSKAIFPIPSNCKQICMTLFCIWAKFGSPVSVEVGTLQYSGSKYKLRTAFMMSLLLLVFAETKQLNKILNCYYYFT